MVNAAKKNVVVVGGGYAGIGVINSLDGKLPQDYRIVLVEKQDFMFLKMAGARVSASEDIANDVLVAYNRLFKNAEQGVVVQASVTEIKPHSVVLSTPHKLFGSEIDFEYLVRKSHALLSDFRLSPRAVAGMIRLNCTPLRKRKP
jgi:NADH dehydrogenase FAD-containing subunit